MAGKPPVNDMNFSPDAELYSQTIKITTYEWHLESGTLTSRIDAYHGKSGEAGATGHCHELKSISPVWNSGSAINNRMEQKG